MQINEAAQQKTITKRKTLKSQINYLAKHSSHFIRTLIRAAE